VKLLKRCGRRGKNPAVGVALSLMGLLLILISGPDWIICALIGGLVCCAGAVLFVMGIWC